jgi:hypothetical protein
MRYDSRSPVPPTKEPLLARAKDTTRAEARRRTRELTRAEQLAADEADLAEMDETPAETVPAPRPRMFKAPDVRGDLRALPSMFRTRRLLWVPLILLVAGMALTLALPGLSPEIGSIAGLYVQFFFIPPALFTFFLAGFFAPRASYLVGLLYGLLAGLLWSIVILGPGLGLLTAPGSTAAPGTPGADAEPLYIVLNMLLIGALYGTLAAAFASWYRDFLRGMQERGKTRRAEQEAKLRAQRRDERQESRRVAKQRT